MKTIILATDFSKAAENAAKYAFGLAHGIGLIIEVLNVVELPIAMPAGVDPSWSEQEYELVKKGSVESMDLLCKKLTSRDSTEITDHPTLTHRIRTGSLSVILGKKMRKKDMMMAVAGISDKTDGFSRFFLGSRIRELISDANYPLLLVPPGAKYKPLTKIAFASELDLDDVKRVKDLIGLVAPFHAEILVINICDTSTAIENMEKVNHFIEALSDCSDYDNIYYGHITDDHVTEALEKYSKGNKADVLVMVHRKRHGLEGLLKGSITKKIIRHTSIPLLVLPEKKRVRFTNVKH